MSEAKKTTLADIKPGHSIFDEAWARSEPQSKRYASHLTQLYEAKIEIEQLRADRDALLEAAKIVLADYKDSHRPIGIDLSDSIRVFLGDAVKQAESH